MSSTPLINTDKLLNDYLRPLVALFEEHADLETAVPMAKYMRDQFPFLCLKSPQRKALFKQFLAEEGLPPPQELEAIVRDLWQLPQREYQYTAQDFLHRLHRHIQSTDIGLIEYLITTKSWWDTVDGLASHAVGDLFRRFPDTRAETVQRWRHSGDFWLRRTTLLFQLGYKQATDEKLLFSLIHDNLDSDEFFIQKAIGWALREYSKTSPDAVREFVARTPLAPLSEREALKWMKGKGIQ
jgi:3-methyladenine DNA glycosylase AlkD